MNKFLMMSAAAVMGAMAAAPQANAGTFQGTVYFKNAAGTGTYCNFMYLYKGLAGTYSAIDDWSRCSGVSADFAAQGFPVKGKISGVKGVAVSDISFYRVTGAPDTSNFQISIPLTGKKAKWNVWTSTDGTTGFIISGGIQARAVTAGNLKGHESVFGKLASILKDRQKQ